MLQGSILGGSIINLDQPKPESDKPLSIEITDELPKKPHHHRAQTNGFSEINLPAIIIDQSQGEGEKVNNQTIIIKESSTKNLSKELSMKDLSTGKKRLARSPTETSVSKRSQHSVIEGISSSQKYAMNLSKKYLAQNVPQSQEKEKESKPVSNNFVNQDLSQLSINQSTLMKSPSPTR